MIPPVQHDVLRLQVAVDDPVLVEVVQRQQDLAKYIKHNMVILLPVISVLDPDPIGTTLETDSLSLSNPDLKDCFDP